MDAIIKKLDALARKAIKKRDNGNCQICYKKGTEVHHYFTRANKKLRFDPENLILLCFNCHRSAHYNKLTKEKIEQFFINKYGKKWVDDILLKSRKVFNFDDYEYFENILKNIV